MWSPMLSNVGTNGAMIGMAESLKKYLGARKFYLINVYWVNLQNLKIKNFFF